MKLQPNQTQRGSVVISRQRDGTFRCVDTNGAGIATVGSYAEAVRVAGEHDTMRALVRMMGRDTAIRVLREGSPVFASRMRNQAENPTAV